MPGREFQAKLGDNEGIPLIEVPFDVKEAFGKARAPVKISVNGYSFRSTVAVYGGKYYIGVRKDYQAAAGVKVGDKVQVSLELDEDPRVVAPPPDLTAALAKNAAARKAWERLSFTHQREHAEAILEAKKPETRARRVEKTIAMLTEAPAKKKH